jgi:hypothetical protein
MAAIPGTPADAGADRPGWATPWSQANGRMWSLHAPLVTRLLATARATLQRRTRFLQIVLSLGPGMDDRASPGKHRPRLLGSVTVRPMPKLPDRRDPRLIGLGSGHAGWACRRSCRVTCSARPGGLLPCWPGVRGAKTRRAGSLPSEFVKPAQPLSYDAHCLKWQGAFPAAVHLRLGERSCMAPLCNRHWRFL